MDTNRRCTVSRRRFIGLSAAGLLFVGVSGLLSSCKKRKELNESDQAALDRDMAVIDQVAADYFFSKYGWEKDAYSITSCEPTMAYSTNWFSDDPLNYYRRSFKIVFKKDGKRFSAQVWPSDERHQSDSDRGFIPKPGKTGLDTFQAADLKADFITVLQDKTSLTQWDVPLIGLPFQYHYSAGDQGSFLYDYYDGIDMFSPTYAVFENGESFGGIMMDIYLTGRDSDYPMIYATELNELFKDVIPAGCGLGFRMYCFDSDESLRACLYGNNNPYDFELLWGGSSVTTVFKSSSPFV